MIPKEIFRKRCGRFSKVNCESELMLDGSREIKYCKAYIIYFLYVIDKSKLL